MHTQHRVDIHIYWFGGLRDQLGRLNIDTLRSWLTPVLAAVAVGLLALIYLSGRTLAPVPSPAPAPPVVRPEPLPLPNPQPDPDPDPASLPVAPVSPLAKAAVQYRDRLGLTFAALRDQVKDGRVQTKQQAADLFAASRKPLGAAMNAAVDAHCDKDGKVTDPDGLAADLDRAAKALGAK